MDGPELLLAPVPDRPEVRELAAVQQPLAVVARRAAVPVMQTMTVVDRMAVVQAGAALVLEVVALAAVDRMP